MRTIVTRSAQKKLAGGELKSKQIKKVPRPAKQSGTLKKDDTPMVTRSGIQLQPSPRKSSRRQLREQKVSPLSQQVLPQPSLAASSVVDEQFKEPAEPQEKVNVEKLVECDNESQQSTSFDSDSLKRVESLPTLASEMRDLTRMLSSEPKANDESSKVELESVGQPAPKSIISDNSTDLRSENVLQKEGIQLSDAQLPSVQIKQHIKAVALPPQPTTTLSPYENFEERLDLYDRKVRREELLYARFMARRTVYASNVSEREFKRTINAVIMRLVHYDPNFDFSYPEYLRYPPRERGLNLPSYTDTSAHYFKYD